MNTTVRPRITWVDYAKGIGIVLVVLGHVLRGLVAGKLLADGPAFQFVDSWIYTFHMPLFFLVSGLFADRQVERGAGDFVRDKLATLAYPYLIWSTLQTLLQAATGSYTNHPTNPGDLAWILIEPIMQFWFLYALFLIGLIYYTMRRCGLGPLGVLAGFVAFWSTQPWLPLGHWSPIHAVRAEGIYYALGSVLHRHGWVERLERSPSVALSLVTIAGYGAIAAWVGQSRAASIPLGLALTLAGVFASMALAVLLGRAKGLGFVRELGLSSLEIFVAHTIASAGIRIVLVKGLEIRDPTVHIVLGTVGGLILPLVLVWICGRLHAQFHAQFLFRLPRRSSGPRAARSSPATEGGS